MCQWISRECALSSSKSAFTEVGYTDFSDLVPGSVPGALHGAIMFTVSLCGRFLLVTHGMAVHIYELNHSCSGLKSRWSLPQQPKGVIPMGVLRPVTKIICPRQVIACSMDTSAGRYAVAFLMEGRLGMVCDIMAERIETSKPCSASTSNANSEPSTPGSVASITPRVCICQDTPVTSEPPIEGGTRSVYRNICHSDDPPRSVALCPQRNCVAFGCSSSIKLH